MFQSFFKNRGNKALKALQKVSAGPVRNPCTRFNPFFAALCLLMICLCFSGCAGQKGPSGASPESQPAKVFCTIYPLYDFAKNIGKDKADVSCLVPPGTEPHEWEPSPKDIALIQKADLFVYCGAGMESWADKVLKVVAGPNLTIVDASRDILLLTDQEEENEPGIKNKNSENAHESHADIESHDDARKDSGHIHEHNSATDPHIWVDPVNAMKMVESIAAGLVQADPANKLFYETNAREYLNELEALDNAYRNGLARTARREFITSHAAFGYLAKRYDLVQVSIRGLSPEVEPTPARMAEIIKLINEKKIPYIFFETLVSPKVSQIIADEAGAQTLVLNPVGGLTTDELNTGKNYLSVMRENLLNLQTALEVEP